MPTVLTSIRIPKNLYDWLKDKAKKEHRTISNTIISILEEQKLLTEEEYIKKAEAGNALLELNAYHDYVIAGNPPDKTQKTVQELKDKMHI